MVFLVNSLLFSNANRTSAKEKPEYKLYKMNGVQFLKKILDFFCNTVIKNCKKYKRFNFFVLSFIKDTVSDETTIPTMNSSLNIKRKKHI